MPKINYLKAETAFKLPAQPLMNEENESKATSIDTESMKHYANLIETYLSGTEYQGKFRSRYQDHFFGKHNLTKALHLKMISIMQAFQRDDALQLAEDKKKVIAEMMGEGVSACPGGFLVRMQEISESLYDDFNLTHLLWGMRTSIVKRTLAEINERYDKNSKNEGPSVHVKNFFFLVAEKEGYGLRAESNDTSFGYIPEPEIKKGLAHHFQKHYQPMQIYGQVMEELCAKFVYLGYHGVNTEKGYTAGDYDKWQNMLYDFLHKDIKINLENLLLFNDDYLPVDMNWPELQAFIWQNINKRIFDLPEPFNKVIDALMDENAPFPDNSGLLFSSKNAIVVDENTFLSLFCLTHPSHQKALLETYMKSLSAQNNKKLIGNMLQISDNPLHRAIFYPFFLTLDIPEKIALCQKDETLLLKLMRQVQQDNKETYDAKELINSFEKSTELPLEIIPKPSENKEAAVAPANTRHLDLIAKLLTAEDKGLQALEAFAVRAALLSRQEVVSILSLRDQEGHNLLMLAIKYHPQYLPLLKMEMSALEAPALGNLLVQHNHKGWNAFMMAAPYPERMAMLLKLLPQITAGKRDDLFKQRTTPELYSLMMIALNHKDTYPALLPHFEKLTPQALASNYLIKNRDGQNLMEFAEKNGHLLALPKLRTTANNLSIDDKQKTVQQTKSPMLKVIECLKPDPSLMQHAAEKVVNRGGALKKFF